jgi:hypothetical protein
MRTLTIVSWAIDGLIILYCLGVMARNSAEWSGIPTMMTIIVLLLATVITSVLLSRNSPNRGRRILALVVAGAIPLVGGAMFLAVALIAVIAMITGARWN